MHFRRRWAFAGSKVTNSFPSSSLSLSNITGQTQTNPVMTASSSKFRLLSLNILAGSLVDHKYDNHDPNLMSWDSRCQCILGEITMHSADIVTLQEVDHWNFDFFLTKLSTLGYTGVYKQKTSGNDGLATFWHTDRFTLESFHPLDFFRSENTILDKGQVATVVLLRDIKNSCTKTPLAVANTHLLFNTRRGDIKTAQLCLLLEHLRTVVASSNMKMEKAKVLLCGDLNFTPQSYLYYWLSTGILRCATIEPQELSGQFLMESHQYEVDYYARGGLGETTQTGHATLPKSFKHRGPQYGMTPAWMERLAREVNVCSDGYVRIERTRSGSVKELVLRLPFKLQSAYSAKLELLPEEEASSFCCMQRSKSSKDELHEYDTNRCYSEPVITTTSKRRASSTGAWRGASHSPCLLRFREPAYTAYHGWQKGCIDYIWLTTQTLQVIGRQEMPSARDVEEAGPIPNQRYKVSDHFSLLVDLEYVEGSV